MTLHHWPSPLWLSPGILCANRASTSPSTLFCFPPVDACPYLNFLRCNLIHAPMALRSMQNKPIMPFQAARSPRDC